MLFATGMLVDLSVAIKQVTVSVAIMQLEVSRALCRWQFLQQRCS